MRSIVIFRFFSHLSLLFVYQCITFLPLIFRFSLYRYEKDLETTDAGSDSLVFAAILCDCTQVSSSPSPQALYGH